MTPDPAPSAHPVLTMFEGRCFAYHVDGATEWRCLDPIGHAGNCGEDGSGHTPGTCPCPGHGVRD